MAEPDGQQQPALSGALGETVFENMLKLWIDSELERRGGPPEWTREKLTAFQVLMRVDTKPLVLLNHEVKIVMSMKLKDGITKKKDEPVFVHEIDHVQSLRPAEEHDAAHVSAVRIGDGWSMAFDFRYNLTWASEHARAAREFLDTARDALKLGRRRSAVDNAATSAELAAKAILLTSPDKVLLDKKSHAVVHEKFNVYAKLNVPDAQRTAFNRLRQIRPGARYIESDPPADEHLAEMLDVLEGLVKDAEARTRPRDHATHGSG